MSEKRGCVSSVEGSCDGPFRTTRNTKGQFTHFVDLHFVFLTVQVRSSYGTKISQKGTTRKAIPSKASTTKGSAAKKTSNPSLSVVSVSSTTIGSANKSTSSQLLAPVVSSVSSTAIQSAKRPSQLLAPVVSSVSSTAIQSAKRPSQLLAPVVSSDSSRTSTSIASLGSPRSRQMGALFSSSPRGAGGGRESITAITKAHPIVVFSSSSCPYCSEALSVLESNGHTPHVVNATGAQRAILREMTSSGSVPNVWVKGV